MKFSVNEYLPSAENPGVEVNCSISMILTAYCLSFDLFVQRRTTLNGPLQKKEKELHNTECKNRKINVAILSNDFIEII